MVFVVTATRMEQPLDTVGTTVSVVGAHQIEEQQIHASGDVLRQVPGVEINQSGSAGNADRRFDSRLERGRDADPH